MLLAVGVVLAVVLVYGATVWFRIDRVDADLGGSGGTASVFLLIGSDRRVAVPGEDTKRFGSASDVPGERADIVIVVAVDPGGAVRALSIPRDLTLFRRNRGPERLATMLSDGPGAIADALCNSLGIGVDHLAVVRFDGLVDLVDLAGGVRVDPANTYLDRNSGLMIKGGPQRVDGRTALAYVRARQMERRDGNDWVPDPIESARRGDRAMEVLRGIGAGTHLTWNPWHDHQLAWTATGAVTVDSEAGAGDLLDLDAALRKLDGRHLTDLPVLARNGNVPTASVTPDAIAVIDTFRGAAKPAAACATPALLSGRG